MTPKRFPHVFFQYTSLLVHLAFVPFPLASSGRKEKLGRFDLVAAGFVLHRNESHKTETKFKALHNSNTSFMRKFMKILKQTHTTNHTPRVSDQISRLSDQVVYIDSGFHAEVVVAGLGRWGGATRVPGFRFLVPNWAATRVSDADAACTGLQVGACILSWPNCRGLADGSPTMPAWSFGFFGAFRAGQQNMRSSMPAGDLNQKPQRNSWVIMPYTVRRANQCQTLYRNITNIYGFVSQRIRAERLKVTWRYFKATAIGKLWSCGAKNCNFIQFPFPGGRKSRSKDFGPWWRFQGPPTAAQLNKVGVGRVFLWPLGPTRENWLIGWYWMTICSSLVLARYSWLWLAAGAVHASGLPDFVQATCAQKCIIQPTTFVRANDVSASRHFCHCRIFLLLRTFLGIQRKERLFEVHVLFVREVWKRDPVPGQSSSCPPPMFWDVTRLRTRIC